MGKYLLYKNNVFQSIAADEWHGFLVEPESRAPLLDHTALAESHDSAAIKARIQAAGESAFSDDTLTPYLQKAPQKGVIADKLMSDNFNFTPQEVLRLIRNTRFFAENGNLSLVQVLYQHDPEHNSWGNAEVQKAYGYSTFWNALIDNDADAIRKFGEDQTYPLPGFALYNDKFQPVVHAVERHQNEAFHQVLDAFQGKRFAKSILKAAFTPALIAGNTEAVRDILAFAKGESSDKFENFAQSLVMSKNNLSLAFAKVTENHELYDVLAQHAPSDLDVLTSLSRRPKLKKVVEQHRAFVIPPIDAIERKSDMPDDKGLSIQLSDPAKPLDEVVESKHPNFSMSVYDALLSTIQLTYKMEDRTGAEEAAYRMAVVFDDVQEARAGLAKLVQNLSDYDSLSNAWHFRLPDSHDWQPAPWRQAILEHGSNASALLREAARLEGILTPEERSNNLDSIVMQCASEGTTESIDRVAARKLLDTLHPDWNREAWETLIQESPKDAAEYMQMATELAHENGQLNRERADLSLPIKALPDLTAQDIKMLVALKELREAEIDQHQQVYDLLKNSIAGNHSSGCLSEFQSPCTFGVEIEMFGLDDRRIDLMNHMLGIIQPGWTETEDGSIEPDDDTRDVEMVTPILQNEDAGRLHAAVHTLKALGAKVAGRCALHVHAGIANVFPAEQQLPVIKQALINYAMLEDKLSFMDGELTDRYSDVFKNQELSLDQAIQKIIEADSIEALETLTQPDGRQGGRVNLHAIPKHGTIEFRQHPGTVEPDEVTGWVRFVDRFMAKSSEMAISPSGAHKPSPSEMIQLEQLVADYKQDKHAGNAGPYRKQSSILERVADAAEEEAQRQAGGGL